MNYVKKINRLLQPEADMQWKVLDLFAGCGGLSLGFENVRGMLYTNRWYFDEIIHDLRQEGYLV